MSFFFGLSIYGNHLPVTRDIHDLIQDYFTEHPLSDDDSNSDASDCEQGEQMADLVENKVILGDEEPSSKTQICIFLKMSNVNRRKLTTSTVVNNFNCGCKLGHNATCKSQFTNDQICD